MTYPLTTLYLGYAERIPFFHFFPGIRTVSVGTYGCNLNCSYCMNQHLLNEPAMFLDLSPEQVTAKSRAAGAGLISFSANEPAVSFPYFLDIAQAAREQDLLMGCSTNGLFTDAQISELVERISCVNVSLKGPDSDFYREVCRGGSFERVVEILRALHASGVHVEVTTPYITTMTRQDMLNIAQTISGISRQIPWHIFRLLPEYRCTDLPSTQIVDMIELKNEAAGLLDFVYLENFPNSLWVDTLCPACGELIFKRVSTGGCGATLFSARAVDGACPGCGSAVPFVGSVCMEGADKGPGDDPRKGVIEVGGWKSEVDMATCLPADQAKPWPLEAYIASHSYPGDMTPTSDAWVTDMALAAVETLRPDLVVATYSQCSFVARHREDEDLYLEFTDIAHREIQRLITLSGYDYLVVGLGDMVPVKGTINLERHIQGIASADEGIAALFYPGPGDARSVSRLEGVSAVHSRRDIEEMLGQRLDPEICGECFVVPCEGWRFLAFSSSSRFSHRIDAMDATVPAWGSIAVPGHIREIRGVLAEAVSAGRKVLLVILDGVGNRSFPFEGTPLGNSFADIPYASSLHQYMVISTGEKVCPHFFAYPHWKSSPRINPLSRHVPYLTDCLTADVRRSGRTAVSVGNRSIITHTAFPADLTIECHCAALHHYGTLEVIP
jgi:pyruvate-formate lyase-activating enzyme